MKEYIKDILYEGSGLLIGKNERGSIILGQNNSWVILDKNDIKNVKISLLEDKDWGDFDGFNFRSQKSGLSFNQYGDSVYIDKSIFDQYLRR